MIRRAQQEDCRRLAELHTAAWQDAYRDILPKQFLDSLDVDARETNWIKVIGEDKHQVYLHFNCGELVGFASTCPSRDSDSGTLCGELSAIYYRRSSWGLGLATELMSYVLDEFEKAGYRKTTLWVLRNNDRAIGFYRKHGYASDGVERTLEKNGVVFDEIRMARS